MKHQPGNLLTSWYRHVIENHANLDYECAISESTTTYIYSTFEKYFGLGYFQRPAGKDHDLQQISWLFTLLANPTELACHHALHDVAQLVNYVHTLDHHLVKEFYDQKVDASNLRTFLFELFVYRMLDSNKIPNQKKPLIDGIERDATCVIMGETFVAECRKNFMPNIEELHAKVRIMTSVEQEMKRVKPCPFLVVINLNRPVRSRCVPIFRNVINKYATRLNSQEDNRETWHFEATEGELTADKFDAQTLKSLEDESKYDVLFYSKPTFESSNYETKVQCNFIAWENEIYERLERAMKEKKKQHKSVTNLNKIFFFDSETLPEFNMGLFHAEGMLKVDKVLSIYEKLRITAIVCLIERRYSSEGPKISAIVITPTHLHRFGRLITAIVEKAYDY